MRSVSDVSGLGRSRARTKPTALSRVLRSRHELTARVEIWLITVTERPDSRQLLISSWMYPAGVAVAAAVSSWSDNSDPTRAARSGLTVAAKDKTAKGSAVLVIDSGNWMDWVAIVARKSSATIAARLCGNRVHTAPSKSSRRCRVWRRISSRLADGEGWLMR